MILPGGPEAPAAPRAAGASPFWARGRPALLAALVLAAAAVVALGGLHRLSHGDAFVPVLVSLQRWTPFYWEQERYGMLVPLLAWPARDPLWNLLLQRLLLGAAGLGAVLLLARHALAGRDWPLAGALAAALLLAVAPAPWLFEYLFDQPYGLALALALAGLALAEPGPDGRRQAPRLAAGLALVLVAHWVNAATGLVLLAVAAGRAAADLADRDPGPGPVLARLAWDAGLLAAGLAAGQALLRLFPAPASGPFHLDVAPLPIAALPGAWAALLGAAWRAAGAWPPALGAAAAAGTALLALPALRGRLPGALVRALALCAAALAYALFAGSLRWVQENRFHWRYVAPSALLVHLAAVSLLAEPLARLRRAARPAALAALALLPAAAFALGRPSLARVRAELDVAAGRLTPDLLAARCDLLAGSYWTVWPGVWHAALALRERGEAREVNGISHRAGPTLGRWAARRGPGLRVCWARGEEAEAERWLRTYGPWPVRPLGRAGDLVVAEPGL